MNVPPPASGGVFHQTRRPDHRDKPGGSPPQAESPIPRRWRPLMPGVGWRWLWKRTAQTPKEAPCLALSRPRRMRRTARSVVLWTLCCYAAAQLPVLLVMERWKPALPANEERKGPQLRRLVAAHPDRPLVLMFGSSRTAWAFRAGHLDGMPAPDGRPLLVYNFGMPTVGSIHHQMYLRELLAEGIRPRLLLVELTPPLLCQAHRGFTTEESMLEGAWTDPRQLRRMAPYFEHPGRKLRTWLQSRAMSWYTFRTEIQTDLQHLYEGTIREGVPDVDEWGWRTLPEEPPTAEERAATAHLAVTMYGASLTQFRPGAGPIRALRDLLELCSRERIQVALILMPEAAWFHRLYSPAVKATVADLRREVRERHGIEVIDATRWLADEDFEDGHHTVLSGANLFTAALRVEIQRLLSQQACSPGRRLGE